MSLSTENLKLELIAWVMHLQERTVLEQLYRNFVQPKTAQEALFFSLAGSWQGEESGDQLAQDIYESRNDTPRDFSLGSSPHRCANTKSR